MWATTPELLSFGPRSEVARFVGLEPAAKGAAGSLSARPSAFVGIYVGIFQDIGFLSPCRKRENISILCPAGPPPSPERSALAFQARPSAAIPDPIAPD